MESSDTDIDRTDGEHTDTVAEQDPGGSEPETLADRLVAESLQRRESACTHNCGSDDGGCDSCATKECVTGGVEGIVALDMVLNGFVYNDTRRIVEVEYRGARREFVEVSDPDLPLRVRDLVLIQSERGIDAGTVSMTGSLVHAKRKAKKIMGEPLSALVRKADAKDTERHRQNRVSEKEAMSVCRSRIESFGLPMELVDTEWQFDHHRITFFFISDGRVDFRELVRDLAAIFHTRIELRQIPVRDEAKRIGGVGICGRELCCTTHLGRYEHITLDHAKAQQLQANPTKLSGQCGRLKCCLLYEVDNYVNGLKRFPAIESTVMTTKGEGIVQKIDIFRDLMYIYHPDLNQWETLSLEELKALAADGALTRAKPVKNRPPRRSKEGGGRHEDRGTAQE